MHPDRSVGYEVYVQEWRTEEEHTLAKERQEIWEPPISSSACNSDVNSSSEVSVRYYLIMSISVHLMAT